MNIRRAILCGFLALSLHARDRSIDVFFEEVTAEWMRSDPLAATRAQYFSGREQDRLDRKFPTDHDAQRRAAVNFAKRRLAELKKFDASKFSDSERASAATLEWYLDRLVQSEPFALYEFPFHQFRGRQAPSFLTQIHPMRNRRDVENYLARLENVGAYMKDAIADAKERERKGILPPKFIVEATIEQFERFLASAPTENVYVTSLRERAEKIKDFSEEDQRRFASAAEKIVAREVIPSYRAAQALLKQQLPKTTDEAGIWRFPNGAAAYADALREFTMTDLTPDQVHEIGLQEVERIEKRMDGLLRKIGYNDGAVSQRMTKLNADLQPRESDPRPNLLARYADLIRDAEKRSDSMFDLRPKAPVEVRREPAISEKNAAASYRAPAPDGSRPGIFFVPLPGAPYRMAGMRTLAYHEAIPGHHFQNALMQENAKLPRFLRLRAFGGIGANSEGWALYAEQLAAEAGWYEGDIPGELGQLDAELFRARRLVVDTGLHAKRWTRQQAIDYGIPVSEVERYVVWPGQACSYKMGQLKILELRAKAQKELGEKFSIKEFHNVVLSLGMVPLNVLEDAVADYVRRKAGK